MARGVIPGKDRRFPILNFSDWSTPHSAFYPMSTGVLSPKHKVVEVWSSPVSSDVAKSAWTCTSNLPYISTSEYIIKDTFTCHIKLYFVSYTTDQGCGVRVADLEGILGGAWVSKNVLTLKSDLDIKS